MPDVPLWRVQELILANSLKQGQEVYDFHNRVNAAKIVHYQTPVEKQYSKSMKGFLRRKWYEQNARKKGRK
jgi:hypothetical protein